MEKKGKLKKINATYSKIVDLFRCSHPSFFPDVAEEFCRNALPLSQVVISEQAKMLHDLDEEVGDRVYYRESLLGDNKIMVEVFGEDDELIRSITFDCDSIKYKQYKDEQEEMATILEKMGCPKHGPPGNCPTQDEELNKEDGKASIV